ncbi:MAG TPA: hypothetical protein VHB21_21640, partial [Minicystis sp.]|nr:hypothetical protein [Minicystis sp.]
MGALSRALVVACVGALGCAGARTQVVAPASRVPVSMSRAVRDAHGDVVPAERRKVVAKFHDERSAWAIFYSAIPFNPTTDISDEVNAQVSRTGGDAVTHLAVTARPCALNY